MDIRLEVESEPSSSLDPGLRSTILILALAGSLSHTLVASAKSQGNPSSRVTKSITSRRANFFNRLSFNLAIAWAAVLSMPTTCEKSSISTKGSWPAFGFSISLLM